MKARSVRTALTILLIAAAFVAGLAWERWHVHRDGPAVSSGEKKPAGYHCPMHPNVRSDKPGNCGICGMRLVPDEDPGEAASVPSAERKVLHYADPHDPKYTSDKPGLNPETGNELVPVYADDAASMPPGTIRISPEKQQLVGVRYGVAEQDSTGRTIRANGRVLVDETRVARVQTRIEGWVEKVHVDFVGKLVEKGQPLLTLYSPEMLASQGEYLLALRSRDILRRSADSRLDPNGLVEAGRRRLELLNLTDAQIRQIEESGKPLTNITLHAPVSGFITTKNALPNQKVTPETELYTIADLSRVWVMADVYEYEAGSVRTGQPAVVTATAYPGERFPAKVSYIQPQMNAETRTLQVRLELGNANFRLRPDMFVNVELATGGQARIVVPVNAVLNSGMRQTVFVDRGNGYLEPRHVRVGRQSGERIEILEGLRAGERIVISGTFLIDSESQLQSAASGMSSGGEHPAPAAPAPAPAGGSHAHD